MNINIAVPDQVEAALRRKAALCGRDLATYLREVIVEEATEETPPLLSSESPAEYMARLQAIIHKHGIRNGHADDRRESIYAGCGE